jgi:hypothetical protein
MGADLTGWERNDNYYFTAASLKGPWIKRGFFAPQNSLTWNSQTTFVLPIQGSKETTYMFMGDRWSFPKQNSAASYVWQPLMVSGYNISMPEYKEAWKINLSTGKATTATINGTVITATDKRIRYCGNWQLDSSRVVAPPLRELEPYMECADEKDASFSFDFIGTGIAIYGLARPDGGYAAIIIRNSKGITVLNSNVDMYSKYPARLLKFLSPVLKKDTYTLRVTVLGEKWWWKEKSGRVSGSKGNFVSVEKFVISK